MKVRSSRFACAVALMFALSAACGCASHQNGTSTSSSGSTATPSSSATTYLGIDTLSKGYVPALKKNVLVLTLHEVPRGTDLEMQANTAYDGIKGSLLQSNLELAVIKIPMIRTATATSDAIFIYAKDAKGTWSRVQDPAVITAVDRAGI